MPEEKTAPLATAPLVEPESEVEAAPAEGDVFRWLEGLEAQASAPEAPVMEAPPPIVAEPPPPPPPPAKEERRPLEGTTKLSRLAEQLAARKRAKEDDIAKRFESQRAEKEAAMREIQEKMEQKKRPGTGSLPPRPGTGPLGARPGTGPLGARPGTGPLTPPPPAPEPVVAEPPTPKKKAAPPKPITRPKKGKLAKSPYAAQTPSDVLDLAHRAIREGNDDVAVDALSYLIAVGQGLSTVINELESATRARPDAAGLWQVLGDAYMRENHLQKALDAYRQALGQL